MFPATDATTVVHWITASSIKSNNSILCSLFNSSSLIMNPLYHFISYRRSATIFYYMTLCVGCLRTQCYEKDARLGVCLDFAWKIQNCAG
jgi:hypothetical protein